MNLVKLSLACTLLVVAPLTAQNSSARPRASAARRAPTVQELAILRVGDRTTPIDVPDTLVHGRPIPIRFFSHVDGCWGGAGETKITRTGSLIELRVYDTRRVMAMGETCSSRTRDAQHRVSLMITAAGTYTLRLLGRSDAQRDRDSADVRIERRLVVR